MTLKFKNLYFFLIQIAASILILELSSCFYLNNSSNALHRARKVLQPDSKLGWRLQSKINTSFEGKKVITDDFGFRVSSENKSIKDNSPSLLTLGPSSAFGWGVEESQTYTALVAEKLSLKSLNASQIGYSLIQGELLFQQVLLNKLKDLKYVIISYGINDLDKFRFYGNQSLDDLSFFQNLSSFEHSFKNFESYSNFLTLFNLAVEEFLYKIDCSSLKVIQQRVHLNDYLLGLQRLTSFLQKQNINVILVNTPYLSNSVTFKVNEFSQINNEYNVVQKLAAQNNCNEALIHLTRAKSFEPQRIAHDVVELNLALQKFAFTNNLILIDAYNLLLEKSSSSKENFVDPVHPSMQGHQIIARQILANMIK